MHSLMMDFPGQLPNECLFIYCIYLFIYLLIYLLVLKEKLLAPAQYPGCSGSRNIQDNISDLKAQVAANHKVHLNFYSVKEMDKVTVGTRATSAPHGRSVTRGELHKI